MGSLGFIQGEREIKGHRNAVSETKYGIALTGYLKTSYIWCLIFECSTMGRCYL